MPVPILASHSSKQHLWAKRLAEFDKSGRSVAQFCHSIGCSVASFYQWRRKFNATTPPVENRKSDSLPQARPRRKLPAFLQIETSTRQTDVVEIKLDGDDVRVLVPLVAIDSLHTIIAQLRTSCSR